MKPPDPPRSTRATSSARRARAALLGKAQFEDLLGVYEKKRRLTGDGDGRIAIQSKIGQLYEDESRTTTRRSRRTSRSSTAAGDEPSALRSLDRVYQRNAMWKQLADIPEAPAHIVGPDDDKLGHVELKLPARPAPRAAPGRPARRDRRVPRHLDLMPAHERARLALERYLAPGPAARAATSIA